MTEAEFLNLEPRERDALVAEHVMGWTITYTSRVLKSDPPNSWWTYPDGTLRREDFFPTTTWEGAGLVIEKMREDGWRITKNWDQEGWSFELWKTGEYHEGHANTGSLSASLAALKAKGVVT